MPFFQNEKNGTQKSSDLLKPDIPTELKVKLVPLDSQS